MHVIEVGTGRRDELPEEPRENQEKQILDHRYVPGGPASLATCASVVLRVEA